MTNISRKLSQRSPETHFNQNDSAFYVCYKLRLIPQNILFERKDSNIYLRNTVYDFKMDKNQLLGFLLSSSFHVIYLEKPTPFTVVEIFYN